MLMHLYFRQTNNIEVDANVLIDGSTTFARKHVWLKRISDNPSPNSKAQ